MSSRLTTPVSKLTRCFSTTPAAARPTHLISNAPKTASAARKGRKPKAAVVEDSIVETQHRDHSTTTTTTTTTTTPHRPTLTPRAKPIPFMQTFHHSAPKPTPAALATIDRAVLPDLSSWDSGSAAYDPYAHIRVPLLPDTTFPSSSRQPEAADAPLARAPEILVVAANPEQVLPSALTEVGGMGVDGVELGFVHLLGGHGGEGMQGGSGGAGREGGAEESFELGRGMIRDLWKGLVDDVLGPQSGGAKGGSGGGAAAV